MTQCILVFPSEKPGNLQFRSQCLHKAISLPAVVTVTVPARLHLGFLDLNGSLGRRFGSIGLAISDLGTRITMRRAGRTEVVGQESDRVRQYLGAMERLLGLDGTYGVNILDSVPAHAGLGSGTQLALAVAAGVRRLHNLALDIEGDALHLGRGTRSGIGIGLFTRGGLVVDGGHANEGRPAPIVCHLPFPDHWRVVVILDPKLRGMHGADEVTTFAALAPMSDAEAAHLCRLVLMKALPALAEHDLENFGGAIKELQARLGDYFAPVQGGARFASPDVAAVLDSLAGAGALGVGQSSWGPTGFAFAPSPEEAARLATIARKHPRAPGLDIRVGKGLNRGAEIVAHAASHESDS
jgi:beta-ribofuranosylaminobenzene 5'-phosphate synthase